MKLVSVLNLVLGLVIGLSSAHSKDIIGYYPSWRFMERDHLVTQASIPYNKLTIINYAFFYPTPAGDLVGLAPEADKYLLHDLIDQKTGEALPNTSLIDYAEKNDVQVMLSIGGWEDSGNFPHVAAAESRRSRFAQNCVDVIKKYGFHGIDIDWEYPGLEAHNGTPADKENFTLLLQTVRDSLDAHSKLTKRYYPMSFAAPASPNVAKGFDAVAISEILDFINIMTYDFNGAWNPISNHNSPLYQPAAGAATATLDAAFKLYHEEYGIPADKLNVGAAFYGRTFAGCKKLFGSHTGASTYFHPEGFADYQMIVNNPKGFKRQWDSKANVPYLINKKERILVSYDDPESIGLKADYINDTGARGIIIWTIVGDYFEDGSTPLLEELNRKLNPE
ncbi:MAG: glycoside hydrolase family 18 protein [Candidatus Marinimicrobia bacterium]|nr:glycoside hydrolase family 18 protein [FCB group bacterium]MBL7024930.1 glycoside hydrolase family 18 protein [Candidatus Neomarinimicrobiota bacterium]